MAIADVGAVVLDCPDTARLAEFYSAVLDWPQDPRSDEEWREINGPHGQKLGFQLSLGFRPPQWPGVEHGQQFHLDLVVPRARLDEAERQVLELGATLLEGDHGGRRDFRVYADPAGHPFCLCAQ